MDLGERKQKILKAIIQNYLETGEPVGSRTISKYTDLNLSSATIRNEMSDLEELGLIVQPHTSAGRIPSDQGYRFYVDALMQERMEQLDAKEQEVNELKEMLSKRVDKVESMLQQMAKQLATATNYATMISAPQYEGNKIKFIQLSQIEEGKILCVVVLEGNLIKNKVIETTKILTQEELLKYNVMLNTSLAGLTAQEINLNTMTSITNQAREDADLLRNILNAVADAFASEESMEIYTSGATNIFKYPELSDKEQASKLIYTLEEKQQLGTLIKDSLENTNETGIQVYIGNETPVKTMKDCSVVTATYELDDGVRGTIGIIGPKRMDYEKVVKTLNTVKRELNGAFKKEDT